jgi:hypothetical protein
MNKKEIAFLIIVFGIFVIPSMSAITLDKSSLFFNDTYTIDSIIFSQTNTTNITTINFTLDSAISDKINTSQSDFSFDVYSSTTLSVGIKNNLDSGNFFGGLHWVASDGTSGNVPIIISIASTQSQGGCQLNPSIITYQQSVSQGTETDLPKIIFNPTGCTGAFNIQNAYITGGVTTTSGIKPVYIKSLSSQEILLGVDTNGLSSRTYNTKLTVVAFSKTFSELSSINIIVTSGTNPSNNFSLSDLPICSVSNTILSVNNTYSLVCTGIQPDLTIIPETDNNIIGTSVETTSSQYIWYFSPKKIGTYNITAKFFYLNSPVGYPFKQEVKVSSTGSTGGSTNLKFLFTPSLKNAQPGTNVIIQLIDNSTESLVSEPEIFIDAIRLNTTDGYTFYHQFDVNKNYSFRGRSSGYNDLVQSIGLGSLNMNVSIIPENGDDSMQYNLSTPGINATLFLDGIKISNPYIGIISSGNHTIKGIAEGYFDFEKNITIDEGLRVILDSVWDRNKLQYFSLNKQISWQVVYKKEIDSSEESQLASGFGNNVTFTPKKKGLYQIKTDGKILWGQEILDWDWTLWGLNIFIWIGGLVFILILGYLLGGKRSSSDMPSYMGGNVNYG